MRSYLLLALACMFLPLAARAQTELVIESLDSAGSMTFNRTSNAVSYRVEWAPTLDGPWTNTWAALSYIPGEGSGTITAAVPMVYRVVATVTNPPPPTADFLVGHSGSTAFIINGESNPTLTLTRGETYTFEIDAFGYPFWIKTAPVTGVGSLYTNGVVNNGAYEGEIVFTVPLDAPNTLYYINQFYTAMQGEIQIVHSQPPLIAVASSVLIFDDTPINDTSASQSYTVFGNYLNGDITVTPPSGFEVSISSNSGFTSSLVLTQSAWTVSNATVYVRFVPRVTGPYSFAISHDSLNATTAFKPVGGRALGLPDGLDPLVANPTTALVGDTVTLNAGAWQVWEGNNRSYATIFGRYDNADLTSGTVEGPGRDPGSASDALYAETPKFNQSGTFYWTMRISYGGGNDFWFDAPRATWTDLAVSPPASASLAISVSALQDPTGLLADFDDLNPTGQVNLAWSKWSNRDVLIVRSADETFTAPTAGQKYEAGDLVGSNLVIYTGSATNFSDTALTGLPDNYYRFYSQNGNYYSTGTTVQVDGPDFRVVNSGASAYLINGASNPTLTLTRGETYTFEIDAFGHPFWIKTAPVTGVGSLYTNGVLNNGTFDGRITITLPWDAPDTLYYICQFHSGMQGVINVVGVAATPGMSLIPAGDFVMGDTFGEGGSSELPLHTNFISAFYMDQYEVTKAMWDEVRTWALSNGYSFGSTGPGKATDHPVHSIDWYDAIAWCNARSERQGLTPCYTNASGTVYRDASGNSFDGGCNWSANGYRLPTEAEWEKAARGGVAAQRFPWGDTISHSNANYYAYPSGYSYDVNPTEGYHPIFNIGNQPYTSPVGYFAPNGYGLYDMSGNVWEWCWDWYSSSYYSSSPSTDPRGPSSGSYRVLRGGSWTFLANNSRVALRVFLNPGGEDADFGFRCARGL